VTSSSGEVLYDSQEDGSSNLLHWPSPLQAKSYGLLDKPRFFVPEWGAAPIPDGAQVDEDLRISNGYDFGNQVDGDTYVFLLGGDLDAFAAARKDFLALTGPVPELPDFAFGTWFTFWHAYSEDEAKADIQRWETLQLPLDVWGLDIN
jgi:alpha-glucosidase (family GH31 glycosyl hydrolase)